LTAKTSKYLLDVSQLFVQCLTGFLLSLLAKKSIFFEIFRLFFEKSYFSEWMEILEKRNFLEKEKFCEVTSCHDYVTIGEVTKISVWPLISQD
jgi:hypothetical protein